MSFKNCTNCAHLVKDELYGFRVCNRNGARVMHEGAVAGCGSDFKGHEPKPEVIKYSLVKRIIAYASRHEKGSEAAK